MRITVTSRIFEPEPAAASQRLGAVARELAGRGHALLVLTSQAPRSLRPTRDGDAGFSVRRAPVLRDRTGYLRGYLPYLSFDAPAFFRLLFARRPDVVLVEPPPTTGLVVRVACAIRGVPYVYYAADVWSDAVGAMGKAGLVSLTLLSVERAAMRGARSVLSVSTAVSTRLEQLGVPVDRITTLGNGVDTRIFSAYAEPQRPGYPYFVYTGTMSEWQRPTVFVTALARIANRHPDVRIHFFGQGSQLEEVRAEAERSIPGRVEFGDVVAPDVVALWIRGAVAALVSVVPGEGYDLARPTKTYAAAACGTPVIFAGPAQAGDFIRTADLGAAVDFDPDSVATAMESALRDEADGTTDARRTHRVSWARENASLETIARRASDSIERAARARRRRS